jgi:hypothetical protein
MLNMEAHVSHPLPKVRFYLLEPLGPSRIILFYQRYGHINSVLKSEAPIDIGAFLDYRYSPSLFFFKSASDLRLGNFSYPFPFLRFWGTVLHYF